jgi:hypothetical protein
MTRETLASLAVDEARQPAAVSRVLVYFDGNLSDNSDYLKQHGTLFEHRSRAYGAAAENAVRLQGTARQFLLSNERVRNCFSGLWRSHFDPEVHVQSLAVPNVLITCANRSLAEILSHMPNVLGVQRDMPLVDHARSEPAQTHPDPGGEHRNGYTWAWNYLNVPDFHRRRGRGANVEIGLIDSGICRGHPDLSGKLASYVLLDPTNGNFTNKAAIEDTIGHGTHLAGILVGGNHSGVNIGGAPAAQLRVVGFQTPAFNTSWYTHFLRAAERLHSSLNPDERVKVINVSMGTSSSRVSPSVKRFVRSAIQQTLRQIVLFVAAIGNTPGVSAFPARVKGVLSVGAHQPNRRTWPESGRSPDLMLPGTSIYSCSPLKGPASETGLNYYFDKGTSQATAHLTALAALLVDAFPAIPPWEIADALKATASGSRHPNIESAYQQLIRNSRAYP